MKNLFLGILLGFLLGTFITATYAAMSGNRSTREYDKFTETTVGDTAILVTIAE